jgi:hypothetical protein
LFLRATDLDANIELEKIDIGIRTLFIYNNLPNVNNPIQEGGLVQRIVPVAIGIVRLADFDDNTRDGDVLREDCQIMADRLMDQLKIRNDSITPIPDYQTNFTDAEKIHDVILTGLILRFNWTFDREDYYCG